MIGRHQFTDGRGSVILYQIENELSATGSSQRAYIAHLYDKVKSDGITVPVFHNDKGRNGIWVNTTPDSSLTISAMPQPTAPRCGISMALSAAFTMRLIADKVVR
ncbi:hypothetical protein ACFQ1S_25485 [Kibdelosporangium lantanae]|uniref:Beta-galactosidase n=1 Tax=Kibdelosporangium lantanae TaxID=1497396 RepID=A0ABW3MG92_9PSEU